MPTREQSQVENGKAFEFAVATAFSSLLGIEIEASRELENSANSFLRIDLEKQVRFQKSASLAVGHIKELEAKRFGSQQPVGIRFNSDREGQRGDVRDVVVELSDSELGVSCKTNHGAFKHSRLSGKIDFVKKWGLASSGCSQTYWNTVSPIFEELSEIRESSNGTALWSDIDQVPERFYWPILDAFERELLELTREGSDSAPEVSRNLVSYVVGKQDFYKVIDRSRAGIVEILAFNFQDTMAVVRTRVPDHVIGIDRLNGGQYSKTVRMSRGFTFNFRIHSASSRVEPSLKFDITAISLPPSEVYTNHIKLLT
jgi:hypothetical protein